MSALTFLNKPEYWFRPSQIFQRLRFSLPPKDEGLRQVNVPWGDVLRVRRGDAIGRSLLTLGVYELGVSEVLWRLADPGESCLDIGANIGYMTSLLSAAAGTSGRVFSFEPHPKVFERLEENVGAWAKKSSITVYNYAVGSKDGEAELVEPSDFNANEGTASLVLDSPLKPSLTNAYPVIVRSLDSLFQGDLTFGLMKVDVEGAELEVFHGAERLLHERKIRDIVWEDHRPFPSATAHILVRHGYHIYRFAKTMFGLSLWHPDSDGPAKGLTWESVNYLATVSPDRAESRLRSRGWHCFRCR